PEYHDEIFSGHFLDTNPYGLDLHRLLYLVVGDKAVAKIALTSRNIEQLQEAYREIEINRILISSAVALRILLDSQKPRSPTASRQCGELYSKWPDKRHVPLTLREACNKIIHANSVNLDFCPCPPRAGSYVRPFVFFYGTLNKQEWRAKLWVVDFV